MAAQAAGGPAQATPAASGTTTTAAQGAQAQGKYSKTGLKWPLKKKDQKWFSIPIIASCRSKVLH